MPPSIRRALHRAGTGALVLAIAGLVLAGCASPIPVSFDPTAPCDPSAREQMPGAYPALESRVPTELDGQAAASRDSGRFCSVDTLGSVFEAGVAEVRFGGAIWQIGRGGVQMGAFEGDGLTAELMAEEYRRAVERDRATEAVVPTTLTVAGRPAWRIDAINGSSRQAIVVWPSADGQVVQSVVAADVDESVLQKAIAAFR